MRRSLSVDWKRRRRQRGRLSARRHRLRWRRCSQYHHCRCRRHSRRRRWRPLSRGCTLHLCRCGQPSTSQLLQPRRHRWRWKRRGSGRAAHARCSTRSMPAGARCATACVAATSLRPLPSQRRATGRHRGAGQVGHQSSPADAEARRHRGVGVGDAGVERRRPRRALQASCRAGALRSDRTTGRGSCMCGQHVLVVRQSGLSYSHMLAGVRAAAGRAGRRAIGDAGACARGRSERAA